MKNQINLQPKFENWGYRKLYQTYQKYKSLENSGKLSRLQKINLEIVTELLGARPLEERLFCYEYLKRKIKVLAKLEKYEQAHEFKREAEEFKARFINYQSLKHS